MASRSMVSRSWMMLLTSPMAPQVLFQALWMMEDWEVQVWEERTNFSALSHPHCPPFHTRQAIWSAENSFR